MLGAALLCPSLPSGEGGGGESRNSPSHFMLQNPEQALYDGQLGLYADFTFIPH